MKMLITVISGLLVGLSMASSNFSPIHELQHFLTNKRRIFYSFGVMVAGFVFLFTALVISLVEGALQTDAQGFVMWSSLFTVASAMAVVGVGSLIAAKLMVPAPVEYHESIFKELNRQFGISEGLELLLKRMAEARDSEPQTPPAPSRHEEKFAEARSTRESVFQEAANSDVMHH